MIQHSVLNLFQVLLIHLLILVLVLWLATNELLQFVEAASYELVPLNQL